jgi:hypothetical protein
MDFSHDWNNAEKRAKSMDFLHKVLVPKQSSNPVRAITLLSIWNKREMYSDYVVNWSEKAVSK